MYCVAQPASCQTQPRNQTCLTGTSQSSVARELQPRFPMQRTVIKHACSPVSPACSFHLPAPQRYRRLAAGAAAGACAPRLVRHPLPCCCCAACPCGCCAACGSSGSCRGSSSTQASCSSSSAKPSRQLSSGCLSQWVSRAAAGVGPQGHGCQQLLECARANLGTPKPTHQSPAQHTSALAASRPQGPAAAPPAGVGAQWTGLPARCKGRGGICE